MKIVPVKPPEELTTAICKAIDNYTTAHSELSVIQTLGALEVIRSRLTECLLEELAK
jgi:hypothetical protein